MKRRAAALLILLALPMTAGAATLPQLEAALAADPNDMKAANEYRREVIKAAEYDRAIEFFKKLVADHPKAA